MTLNEIEVGSSAIVGAVNGERQDVGFRHVGQSFGSFIRLKGMSWLS